MNIRQVVGIGLGILMLCGGRQLAEDEPQAAQKADGYRGVWYQNQPLKSEYKFKYSGGLGTYCAKHKPFAVYRPEVDKTFFCYGGVPEGFHKRSEITIKGSDLIKTQNALLHMVSYFDHRTGEVPKPTILLDKKTYDAHDNPVISMDDAGYLWIFSTAHGTIRPAYVHRSTEPYGIDAFERVEPYRVKSGKKVPITNFSYMQAWHMPKQGFVMFFTKYEKWRRETCFATSADGTEWSNWTELANIEKGHYQVSAVTADKAACSFNYHPGAFAGDREKRGLNWRTNLYYMETPDFGKTWQAADGTVLTPPLTKPDNAALVYDFEKEKRLVYLKDLVFDGKQRPVILFVTASGYESGPISGPRTWHIARWSGEAWSVHNITDADSNYDMGSLYVDAKTGQLRLIAPTEIGPQPGNPGGEIAMWISDDQGKSWRQQRQMTTASPYNHGFVRRPVNAHPDFYGFWADGHGRMPSPSRLYYCNQAGDVFQLPTKMDGPRQAPTAMATAEVIHSLPDYRLTSRMEAGKKQHVVVYGTSLTAAGAWPKQLQKALNKRYPGMVKITNSGGSGQFSKWGLENLQKKVIDLQPDAVFIEFSMNDAVERFHLPLEQAKANLETMIDRIEKELPDCLIFLQVMNPVIDRPKGHRSHRLNLEAYYQSYRDVAAARGLVLVDHAPAWQAVLDQGKDAFRELVPDGLHPNAKGAEKIIAPGILKALGVGQEVAE